MKPQLQTVSPWREGQDTVSDPTCKDFQLGSSGTKRLQRTMNVACTKDGDVCLAMYVHPILQAGVPVTDGAHIAFIRDGVTGDVYNLYDYTGIPVPPSTFEAPAYYGTYETGFKEIHLLNNPNRETG